MENYIGKICPFCKTEITETDTVKVCPACGIPHHEGCWTENQGCTTFGCTGTIKAADNTASSVTTAQMNYEDHGTLSNNGVIFCTKCGGRNASESSFCAYCGNRLETIAQKASQPPVYPQAAAVNSNPYGNRPSSAQTGGYNSYQSYQEPGMDADLLQLIGPKSEYYIPKFRMLKNEGKSTSWNWPAFLVAPYWLMYRKMYGYAAAALVVDIIVSLFAPPLISLLALGGYIAFGIFANSIYMKYLEKKAAEAKSLEEPYKAQFIASNGGVNTLATVLTVIGRTILVLILST